MKRLVSALAVGCLLLGLVPTALAGRAHPPLRTRADRNLAKIDPSFRPILADKDRKVTVVLELAAEPALTLTGSDADRIARAQTLRATQGRLDARISAIGGKVLAPLPVRLQRHQDPRDRGPAGPPRGMRGVVGCAPPRDLPPTNINAVPYVGAPTAWQASGATGAGQTIAIIDSGIDYTHANFGGPGTTEAYDANDPTIIEHGTFPTAKVIAGYDFAGNDYDATGDNGSTTPTPDPDPLDCSRSRDARRRDGGRPGRPRRPQHVHGPVQRLDRQRPQQVRHRAGRRSQGQACRAQGVRLRGVHRPHRRRPRVGRRLQRRRMSTASTSSTCRSAPSSGRTASPT